MTALCFVDSNVLVYSQAQDEPRKRDIANDLLRMLWRDQNGRLSMQVLSECYAAFTRKAKPPMPPDEAWREVAAYLAWSPQVLDGTLLERAHQLSQRYLINWWDAQIIAAAEAQRCLLLLTEDLQDGATYGHVQVRNPFKTGVQETLASYGADLPAPVSRHRRPGRPPGKRRAA